MTRPAGALAGRTRLTTRRRWLRLVIPFAVVLVLFAVSGFAHSVEQPEIGDAGTFSPTGTGPDGSSRLAALLAERGVTVERQTNSLDVVRSALRGSATIFVPAPGLPNPNLARVLAALRAAGSANRIVLVEPGRTDQNNLPVSGGFARWAPRTPRPSCENAAADRAGRATATRTRYFVDLDTAGAYRCYDGGLVGVAWQEVELVVIGASDPFRNSRIGEHGNAALAVGLLSTKDRLVWLDMHEPEPVSYSVIEGGLGIDLPGADEGGGTGERRDQPNPLWTAVPGPFWPLLVQLGIVALILALWRARRLGPPVAEPLPVVVPAAETVAGRGRLYERADARGPAMEALRTAARHRIQRLLNLPAEAAEVDVVAAVATRSQVPADQIRSLLYGPEPPDDGQLLAAARSLDQLVHMVTHERKAAQ